MMRTCHLTDLTRLDTAILQRPRYGVDLDEGEGGEDGEEEDEFMYQEEQEEQVRNRRHPNKDEFIYQEEQEEQVRNRRHPNDSTRHTNSRYILSLNLVDSIY